jgi:hypothetical protein
MKNYSRTVVRIQKDLAKGPSHQNPFKQEFIRIKIPTVYLPY